MSDREEKDKAGKDRIEKAMEQIAMEWKKIAKNGLYECRELLFLGFKGHAGEMYRNRLEHVLTSMEKTAKDLWEGKRL